MSHDKQCGPPEPQPHHKKPDRSPLLRPLDDGDDQIRSDVSDHDKPLRRRQQGQQPELRRQQRRRLDSI